jgi:hypothetical protein
MTVGYQCRAVAIDVSLFFNFVIVFYTIYFRLPMYRQIIRRLACQQARRTEHVHLTYK